MFFFLSGLLCFTCFRRLTKAHHSSAFDCFFIVVSKYASLLDIDVDHHIPDEFYWMMHIFQTCFLGI